MNSNVKMAHMINAIAVESVVGKGTENDPQRVIMDYFDMEGELLAQRDSWAEETKERTPAASGIDVVKMLQDSWTLTSYINTLLAKDEIEASDDENAFEIALRLLKANQKKLKMYEWVSTVIEESKTLILPDQWSADDLWVELVSLKKHHCVRCGKIGAYNKENKLCFSCWEKLQHARHLADLVTP